MTPAPAGREPEGESLDRRPINGHRIVAGPARVMLVISSLVHGGAQRQLVELVRNLDRRRFTPAVCSLSRDVPLAKGMSDPPTAVFIVPKRWRFDFTAIFGLARLMSRERTQLAHAFLFDAEIATRLAARLAGVPAVVGSERNSDYRRPWLQRASLRLTRPFVDAVIANSAAGKRFVVRTVGTSPEVVHVVPNGVDVTRFRPADKEEARRVLGLTPDVPWVGMVAAFKPQKNHLMLLEVARTVIEAVPSAHFVCAGERLPGAGHHRLGLQPGTGAHRDVGDYYRRVCAAIEERGLTERFRLVGNVDEVERVYAACDMTVLTSWHEGTPNALLESMACGVPVVATDVADNAHLVPDGRVGFVVPAGDAEAMATRVRHLLSDHEARLRMGQAARRWVTEEFSTAALAARTAAVYERLLRHRGILPASSDDPVVPDPASRVS